MQWGGLKSVDNIIMTVAGELCVIGQLVLRGTCVIIPSKLQPRTLALAHEGHLGVIGTK